MKKLSLAMATAMCLTVGGVYATWNYAGNAVNENVDDATVSVGMGMIDSTANVATVTLKTMSAMLTVDGDAQGTNTAVLTPSGNLVVTVDINETSAVTYLTFTYTLSVDSHGTWAGDHIFKYTTSEYVSPTNVTADGDVSISMAELVGGWGLNLREAFSLPKLADYNAFKEALREVKIAIDLEVTANY